MLKNADVITLAGNQILKLLNNIQKHEVEREKLSNNFIKKLALWRNC